jgi:hypothetical protein
MVSERGGGPTLAAAGWRNFLKRAAVHNGDFLDHLMVAMICRIVLLMGSSPSSWVMETSRTPALARRRT